MTLQWGPLTIQRLTGINERTVRRWLDGDGAAPEAILVWLEGLAELVREHPPPER